MVLVLILVQVSVADVTAWDPQKEINGIGPRVFDTTKVEARALHKSMGLI